MQNPKRVQELLSVERYQERWPLIPQGELHASSVQHPDNPSWRWLLHSRRVSVLQPAAEDPDRPPCKGIGDAAMPVWSCRECQQDLCGPHPKLPLNACVNDNWIGRQKLLVRNASLATHWLSSLGRFCWKQVRLGRGPSSSGSAQPAEDVRQTGVSGNTIFFAQPTAEVQGPARTINIKEPNDLVKKPKLLQNFLVFLPKTFKIIRKSTQTIRKPTKTERGAPGGPTGPQPAMD